MVLVIQLDEEGEGRMGAVGAEKNGSRREGEGGERRKCTSQHRNVGHAFPVPGVVKNDFQRTLGCTVRLSAAAELISSNSCW